MYKSEAFFFGVTRFSVYFPRSAAWKISSQLTEEEYISQLYSDERLAPRFEIFLNRALPIYEKFFKDYRYNHIVQFSEQLPEKWKKKLFEAKNKYPFLLLYKVCGEVDYKGVIEEEVSKTAEEDRVVSVFRVDDDDLLSADYMDQLSSYAKFEFVGMSVSFGLGVAAKYSQGSYCDFRVLRKHLMSQGQATIGRFIHKDREVRLPTSVSHAETDLFRPVIIDSKYPAFLQTLHASQDTRASSIREAKVSVIDQELSKYKSVDDFGKFINPFPTIIDDYSRLRGSREVMLDCSGYHEAANSFSFEVDLSRAGSYRVSYGLFFENNVLSNKKGLLICMGDDSLGLSEVSGMSLSKRTDIGWFRYIQAIPGNVENSLEFFIPEESAVQVLKIRGWGCSEPFKVEKMIVEKLG